MAHNARAASPEPEPADLPPLMPLMPPLEPFQPPRVEAFDEDLDLDLDGDLDGDFGGAELAEIERLLFLGPIAPPLEEEDSEDEDLADQNDVHALFAAIRATPATTGEVLFLLIYLNFN